MLITAIRSYHQLHIINQGRRGLELIVGSTIDLFKRTNISMLAQGILTQLLGLMGNGATGLVACSKVPDAAPGFGGTGRIANLGDYNVLTAAEPFDACIGKSLMDVSAPELAETFTRARRSDMGMCTGKQLGLHFHTRQNLYLFIFIDMWREPYPDFMTLLKLFSSNIAVVFENLMLIEELDQLAFYDSLLPIHNRNAFQTEYQTLVRNQTAFSFLRVRVNSLDRHISAFGPNITDSALIQIKEKLDKGLQMAPYFVGFDGKSDFLVLVPRNFNPVEINTLFNSSIRVENVHLQISVTIGVVNPEPDMTPQTVLRNSIATLLEKHNTISESNILTYSPNMSRNVVERLSLQSSLHQAVSQEREIEIYLQPKVSVRERKIVGAEVLCRWKHNGSFIPPDKFIPIAEESGLISRITSLVIKLTGRFVASRRRQGLSTPTCAINLSMFDLQLPNAADKLHAEFIEAGLDSEQIDLEITESAMMRDTHYVIQQLKQLKELGYKLAIDDFGTGYSSLSYLENLPIDFLKVDKKLIDRLTPENARNSIAAIASSIAQTIGLKVIAEGVETLEQETALALLGCDICQGYLYHKPMPVTDFNALLVQA